MDAFVHDAVLDMNMARDELLKALSAVGPDDWGRYVPYGSRTLHDLLAHLAGADQAWAAAAQGLLRGEGPEKPPLTQEEAKAARVRAVARGRDKSEGELLEEMERRRRLLLGLYELLGRRHLALALRSYGDRHNSVRERIWVGYHDRSHTADVRRAMRLSWHPPELRFLPAALPCAAQVAAVVQSLAACETLYVVYNIDPVCWERSSPVPGWTNRDLLAHIATGDWVLQVHLRHLIEHGRPAEWPDIEAGNRERLHERRFATVSALTEEYLAMRHETLLSLSQLTAKHLEQKIELWWEPMPNQHTVLDYLQGFEFHDRQHREQLRPAMKYATAAAAAGQGPGPSAPGPGSSAQGGG